MKEQELLELLDSFINENGLVAELNAFLQAKGYSEREYDELIEKIRNQ
jgi:hypothetical protein